MSKRTIHPHKSTCAPRVTHILPLLAVALGALAAFNAGLALGAPRYEHEQVIANPDGVAKSTALMGVAIDNGGRVLATQPYGESVRVFSSLAGGNQPLDAETIVKPGPGPFKPISVTASKADSRVYVADQTGNRILIYRRVAGKYGQIGSIDLSAWALNPLGVALTPDGKLYVSIADKSDADSLNRIMVFAVGTGSGYTLRGCFGAGLFYKPVAIAHDAAENTYVVDSMKPAHQRVLVFASYKGIDIDCDPLKKDDDPTYLGSIGAEGSGPGQLAAPMGVAVDPLGRVHVSDAANNRVQAFGPVEGAWAYAARYPEPGPGQTGTAGGSGPADLLMPSGVALDGTRVYVADAGNSRLQRLRFDDANADGVFDTLEPPAEGVSGTDSFEGAPPELSFDLQDANAPRSHISRPRGKRANAWRPRGERVRAWRPRGDRAVRPGHVARPGRGLKLIAGTALDGETFVVDVAVALGRRGGGASHKRGARREGAHAKAARCEWLTRTRAVRGKCSKPRFLKARITTPGWAAAVKWRYQLTTRQRRALRRGRWQIVSRATDLAGNVERARVRNANLRFVQLR